MESDIKTSIALGFMLWNVSLMQLNVLCIPVRSLFLAITFPIEANYLKYLSHYMYIIISIFYLLLFLQVFREIKVEGFNASKYETTQVFYPSKDGTKIPMFIVHKKVINLLV